MKYVLGSILLFSVCLCYAQGPDEICTISPAQPKVGETVTITYNSNAPTAQLRRVDAIDLNVLVFNGRYDSIDLKEIPMKKGKDRWTASFLLKDSKALLLLVRFVSGDKVDDNTDNVWDAMVYAGDGKAVKGAHAVRAQLFQYGIQSFKKTKDLAERKKEILAEQELYQDDRSPNTAMWDVMMEENDSKKTRENIRSEIEKYHALDTARDKSVNLYAYWLERIGDSSRAKELKEAEMARDPQGPLVRWERWRAIYDEKDMAKRVSLFEQYFHENPDEEKVDWKFQNYVYACISAKQYDKAADLLPRMKTTDGSLYNQIAWPLIEKGEQLEFAVKLAKKGVELSRVPDPKTRAYYKTKVGWKRGMKSNLGMVLDTYAYGLFQLGKSAEAEKAYAESNADLEGSDMDNNSRFLECLLKNKHYGKAYELGVSFLKKGKADDKIMAELKEAYAKKEGASGGFETLPDAKQRKLDGMIADAKNAQALEMKKKVAAARIKKPSIDFTLNTMDRTPVTLSRLKGKVVILDFWATWCGPCKASFPFLQKVYDRYKGNDRVVFLALNTWERKKDFEETLTNAKKFMEENKYTFPVLLDDKSTVVGSYKVEGIPTKFLIDKIGDIAFESIGFLGPEMEEELTQQIELLLAD